MRKYILLTAAVGLLNACGHVGADADVAVKEQARQFAEAYFNYDFDKARRFVVPESEKWLRFAASNVTQEDVDLVNAAQKAASAEVTMCDHQNDSTVCVMVSVRHVVLKDTIGRPAYTADEAEFALTLVRRGADYQVRMEGLPRNERQSRGSASDE